MVWGLTLEGSRKINIGLIFVRGLLLEVTGLTRVKMNKEGGIVCGVRLW